MPAPAFMAALFVILSTVWALTVCLLLPGLYYLAYKPTQRGNPPLSHLFGCWAVGGVLGTVLPFLVGDTDCWIAWAVGLALSIAIIGGIVYVGTLVSRSR